MVMIMDDFGEFRVKRWSQGGSHGRKSQKICNSNMSDAVEIYHVVVVVDVVVDRVDDVVVDVVDDVVVDVLVDRVDDVVVDVVVDRVVVVVVDGDIESLLSSLVDLATVVKIEEA
ncbi:hypothetical protein MTR_7g096770 [Medicago truncatula]|uniref:Uncharacterized protein n=1 Tax=Medicago truncatula TaxID=3880 RepID=A0A072U2J3_MEDTR|nr:hypothetical protein MTR_7g096770 [Medicago truncatula]